MPTQNPITDLFPQNGLQTIGKTKAWKEGHFEQIGNGQRMLSTTTILSAIDSVPTISTNLSQLETVVQGKVSNNDSRLSDARAPTPHAATHAQGGSDPIAIPLATTTEPGRAKGDESTIRTNADGSLSFMGSSTGGMPLAPNDGSLYGGTGGLWVKLDGALGNLDHSQLTQASRSLPNQHPQSAITGLETALAGKANESELLNYATLDQLALKANTSDMNASLATKANSADVSNALAAKANTADVNTALASKANVADVYSKTEANGLLSQKADLVGGVLPTSQLPPGVIKNLWTVAAQADLVTLTSAVVNDDAYVTGGDVAGHLFKLVAAPPTTLSNWVDTTGTGSGGVISVNGLDGAVTIGLSELPDVEAALSKKAALPQAFYNATIAKSGTLFSVTVDGLPNPLPALVSIRGVSLADYAAGDLLAINDTATDLYTPSLASLPAGAWKTNGGVELLWDTAGGRAFFKQGSGVGGGGDSSEPNIFTSVRRPGAGAVGIDVPAALAAEKFVLDYAVNINATGPVAKVSCGNAHTLLLTEEGTAWAVGYNEDGQLGFPAPSGYTSTLQQVPLPSACVDIAAGINVSFFVLDDGSIFTCGATALRGDGQNGGNAYDPNLSQIPNVPKFTKVFASKYSIVAYAFSQEERALWSWGATNSSGNLGRYTASVSVNATERLATVADRLNTYLGYIYAIDSMHFTGSTVHIASNNAYAYNYVTWGGSSAIMGVTNATSSGYNSITFYSFNPGGNVISSIQGSAQSIIALTSASIAYGWGINAADNYICGDSNSNGTGSNPGVRVINVPNASSGEYWSKIYMGTSSALWVTNLGRVFVTGANNLGMLIAPNAASSPIPHLDVSDYFQPGIIRTAAYGGTSLGDNCRWIIMENANEPALVNGFNGTGQLGDNGADGTVAIPNLRPNELAPIYSGAPSDYPESTIICKLRRDLPAYQDIVAAQSTLFNTDNLTMKAPVDRVWQVQDGVTVPLDFTRLD